MGRLGYLQNQGYQVLYNRATLKIQVDTYNSMHGVRQVGYTQTQYLQIVSNTSHHIPPSLNFSQWEM